MTRRTPSDFRLSKQSAASAVDCQIISTNLFQVERHLAPKGKDRAQKVSFWLLEAWNRAVWTLLCLILAEVKSMKIRLLIISLLALCWISRLSPALAQTGPDDFYRP